MIAQAGERRAQIMRDIVGDLAADPHQHADAAEHGVEAFGEPVEFVAGAGDRQALRQIAAHDVLSRGVHCVDAPQHAPRDEERAGRRERRKKDERGRQRLAPSPRRCARGPRDRVRRAGGSRRAEHKMRASARRYRSSAGDGAIGRVDKAGTFEDAGGNLRHVPGERLARRVW